MRTGSPSSNDRAAMIARVALLAIGSSLGGFLGGCSSCDDDAAEAQKFFSDPANLTCQSDPDCLIIQTGCSQIPASHCGQTPLNVRAARTDELDEHRENLKACAEENCAVCTAIFHAECRNGSCTAIAGFSRQ
jgi:hypothetical protein